MSEDSSHRPSGLQAHLVEMALDAMFVLDGQGHLVEANPAACQFFNRSEPHLVGRPLSEICQPLLAQSGWPRFDEIESTRTWVQGELTLLLWNGEQRSVTYRACYQGLPRCQLWILRDMTAQNQAETHCQQLEAQVAQLSPVEHEVALNEARLRAIFNQAAIGINQAAPDGRFLQVNPTYCRMLGYSESELLTMRFHDVAPSDDTAATRAALQRLYAGEEPSITLEKRYIRKDGTPMWTNTVLSILRDEEGQPISDIAIVEDITQRKLAEQALQDERNLFISGPTVVLKWSPEPGWPVLYVSPNVEAELGYEPTVLTTRTLLFNQLLHPDDCDRIAAEAAHHTAAGRQYYGHEYRLRHANGEYRWFNEFTHVIYDAQGEVVQFLGYIQDITERKQIELALQQSETTKQAMLEAIPDLLIRVNRQGIRHDFISGVETSICGAVDTKQPQSIYDTLPKALADQRMHFLAQALETRERQQYEHTITIEGKQHYEETRIVSLDHDEALVMVRDITQRKQLELELERTKLFLEQTNAVARVGGWEVDLVQNVVRWTRIAREIHEVEADFELTFENSLQFYLEGASRQRITAAIEQARQTGQSWDKKRQIVTAKGNQRWVRVLGQAEFDAGTCVRLYGSFQDIDAQMQAELKLQELTQQLQQANEELNRLAMVDGLTQIANRRQFDQVLAQEWKRAKRDHTFLTLILCDIDFFKPYNDNYGHPAGDRCLCQVADILSQVAQRPGDLVARYGGEEFALVLPKTTIQGAVSVAKRIQAAIADAQIPHEFSAIADRITLSLGVVCCIPQPQHQPDQLIDWADTALYHAKNSGRNTYHLATLPI